MKKMKRYLATAGVLLAVAGLTSCSIGGIFEDSQAQNPNPSQTQQQSNAPSATETPSEIIASPTEVIPSTEPDPYPATGKVFVHYKRSDNNYSTWDLWVWTKADETGHAYAFSGSDDYGKYAEVDASKLRSFGRDGMMFIVRQGGDSWTGRDGTNNDREAALTAFSIDDNQNYHIYLVGGSVNTTPVPAGQGTVEKTVTVALADLVKKNGWADNVIIPDHKFVIDDYITVAFAGGANTGKWNNKSNGIRVYSSDGGTITFSSLYGKKIKSVTIEYNVFDTDKPGTLVIGDSTEILASNTAYSLTEDTLVLKAKRFAEADGVVSIVDGIGNLAITSITVVYQ